MSALRNQTNTAKTKNQNTEISNKEPNAIGANTDKVKWTDIGGMGINFILMVVTALLFWVATKQNNIAERAANAAIEAVAQQRRQDSLSNVQDSISSYTDSVNMSKRFSLDSSGMRTQQRSVQAQIKTLEETRKQIEIANRTYLQIGDIDTFTLNKDKKLAFYFTVSIIGKQPVKIIKGFTNAFIVKAGRQRQEYVSAINMYEKTQEYSEEPAYVTSEHPKRQTYFWDKITEEPNYSKIMSGEYNVCLFGQKIYENLITKKIMLYRFGVEVSVSNHVTFRYFFSDNVPVE
jgi:hypothetical protein